MTKPRTAREISIDINHLVGEATRSALHDLGWFDPRVAGSVGVSKSRVGDWWGDSDKANTPLYLIAHPYIPLNAAKRIVSAVMALRTENESIPVSLEMASTDLLSAVARVTQEIAASIASVTYVRESLRKAIATLRDVCDAWLRVHAQKAGVLV